MSIITGLFKDKESAESAYRSASQSGYSPNEINVIMSEETREKYYGKNTTLETEVGNKAAEGGAIGAAVGGTVGAIAAAIAAVGSVLVLPGLGLVVAPFAMQVAIDKARAVGTGWVSVKSGVAQPTSSANSAMIAMSFFQVETFTVAGS